MRWLGAATFAAFGAANAIGQQTTPRDPVEPSPGAGRTILPAHPSGEIPRESVDEKSMRELIAKLVACGTRLTLSSWTDAKRGVGCGRVRIVERFNEFAKHSGG